MMLSNDRWRSPALPLLGVALLMAGCNTPLSTARQLADEGQHEAALNMLVQTHADRSSDTAARAAYLKERDATMAQLLAKADAARRAGQIGELTAIAQQLEQTAPDDPRTTALRETIARGQRHRKAMAEAQTAFDQQQWSRAETLARSVLEEDPGNNAARSLLTRVSERLAAQAREVPALASTKKPISLEFRDAPLRNVFDTLGHAGDINFVFDKDVRSDAKVSLLLRNVSVDEALRIILATQQLGRSLLNENTVLVYQANGQKEREYQDTVTRSFYLVNASAKQAQDLVKTITKAKDMYVDERLNLLVVRTTPQAMSVVERLIQSIDLPESEVMMEVEVMEVSSNLLRELGLAWPTTVNYGSVPQSSTDSGSFITLSRGMRDSLHAYVSNPLVAARLNGTSGTTNLLASPRIRARNHEKAHVQLGNKLPVFTTTTTGAGSVAGFVASSVSYLDVGLKLDIEPSVLLDDDIVLKVALEVSSVASQVAGPDGSVAYNVGTRQSATSIRLRDGETEILAGLIQDDDRKAAVGIPALSEVPLLGSLFGVRRGSHDKTEIVMLITPHIVRNVMLPPLATAPIPSGTDAQPGAPSLRISAGAAVRAGMSDARDAPPVAAAAPPAPREPASTVPSDPLTLAGPQDAVAGSSFQLTVSNAGPQAQEVDLVFDPDVFESGGRAPRAGHLAVQVPAGGYQTVSFAVKSSVLEGASTFSAGGSVAWTVRLHPAPASGGGRP